LVEVDVGLRKGDLAALAWLLLVGLVRRRGR